MDKPITNPYKSGDRIRLNAYGQSCYPPEHDKKQIVTVLGTYNESVKLRWAKASGAVMVRWDLFDLVP